MTAGSGRPRRGRSGSSRPVGVYEVDDQLEVNLIGADRREDDEIRGVALQALIWDTEVRFDTVDVRVQEGWITLKGNVAFQYQSDAAYDDVASLFTACTASRTRSRSTRSESRFA